MKNSVKQRRQNSSQLAITNNNHEDVTFKEGAIVRIKLENILTYDSVEFQVGPYLNVIIGPNGTGKSTIVCAICIGLGGKLSILGRAQQVADFIKYGCNKGKIELELFNEDGENYIIHREINKNNKSEWTINGRPATHRAVDELVAQKNIQVNNLCQFLPQEKVADFAKMTSEELLENTEKSINNELYDNHQKLKKAREQARSLELGFENIQERLDQEKQKNARLEQDVKNFEERERHLSKIQILQMKRPWVEYDEKRKLYEKYKTERDQKAEEYKQAKQMFAPLQKKLDAMKKRKEDIEKEMKTKTDSLRDYARKAQASSKEIEAFTDKTQEVQNDLKFKRNEELSRKKRVQDLKKQIDLLKSELETTVQTEDIGPQIERVTQEMRRIVHEMEQMSQDGDLIRRDIVTIRNEINSNQHQLKEIQNVENKKLEILRQKHKHTYDAVMWCKENRNKFQGEVHLPMMMTINPKDASMAKFIEMHIRADDLKAFVFENSNDYNLFMNTMRDEQGLKVNALKVPQKPVSEYVPTKSIENYRRYGFQSYLKDYISCPDGIMRYLCAQYRVHAIPVGDRRSKERVEEIVAQCPEFSMFYTIDSQYQVKRSRYDGSISSRSSKIRDPTWLIASGDNSREVMLETQIRQLQAQLKTKEEEYNGKQKMSKELDTKLNKKREEKKELSNKKDVKKRLQSQIDSKIQRMKTEEAEAVNLQTEEESALKEIRGYNKKKCTSLQKLKDYTRKCIELSTEKVRLGLRQAMFIHEQEQVEEDLREQSGVLQNFERAFEEIKEKVKTAKEMAKRLLQAAKHVTNTDVDSELSPELRQSFESCPSTLDEIDAAIHEQQARADSLFQTDERVVKEYRQRKKEIAQLEKDVTNRQQQLHGHQEEVEKAKTEWLEPLRALIERINENFSYFFTCMKCAGEIDLNVPDNPEDYEKYGIKIKVKFRDSESLRELTPHHQSGGERSVSTVLYMMALQELAKCPFRCVDEINQGMDPVNERKVFELVVQTVCRRSASQYFLLTPKLLPDLEYSDNMTVLCVCNGPYMLNHTEWNLKKFIRRRKRLEDE
ncbi:structural maintenance of chromosomes protein 5-like [Mytilus trossulus]|uniref:structural maintenance of chromosomes protein 5-like n=1 Tax=Mytilus trossulus TaxID=6551 RepID=UPI003005A0BF